ncbi:hypothetical protein EJ04DRAFT_555059 [Polyplosphaeria fusca]|uniref:Uncharacterized protein n=1 Tax=Polyplosphaeria fusca TaxID=682080 RepID=A0A9P4QTP9_9PLEO|nr:hypothetical protein EJ04DRAFT_555059 [Polyplosphaeria fusca]
MDSAPLVRPDAPDNRNRRSENSLAHRHLPPRPLARCRSRTFALPRGTTSSTLKSSRHTHHNAMTAAKIRPHIRLSELFKSPKPSPGQSPVSRRPILITVNFFVRLHPSTSSHHRSANPHVYVTSPVSPFWQQSLHDAPMWSEAEGHISRRAVPNGTIAPHGAKCFALALGTLSVYVIIRYLYFCMYRERLRFDYEQFSMVQQIRANEKAKEFGNLEKLRNYLDPLEAPECEPSEASPPVSHKVVSPRASSYKSRVSRPNRNGDRLSHTGP